MPDVFAPPWLAHVADERNLNVLFSGYLGGGRGMRQPRRRHDICRNARLLQPFGAVDIGSDHSAAALVKVLRLIEVDFIIVTEADDRAPQPQAAEELRADVRIAAWKLRVYQEPGRHRLQR